MWDNSSPPPCYGERSWCERFAAKRLRKREARVHRRSQSKHGSQFSVRCLRSSAVEHRAHNPRGAWCDPTRRCLFSSLCSSIAEQPVDNRQTGAQYPAGGPFHSYNAGWCSQSARLPEEEKVRVQFQVQRPVQFQCVIGVTATCLSSKQWMPVQLRHGAPVSSILLPPSVVSSVSTRRCERRGAGANPAEGTIFIIHRAQGKESSHRSAKPGYPV